MILSDPITILNKQIKNRIVFLPCYTFSFRGEGTDFFGSRHLEHYKQAAEGGAGIVYVQGTSVAGVRGDVRPVADQEGAGQWTSGSQNTLRKIVDQIHKNNALAFIQLAWGGDRVTDLNALTTDEIEKRQQDLLAAAILVGELGFDGAEFHFGHGFLLCKIIEAEANKRTDRFGGTLENRVRVLSEILPKIKSANGGDFIIAARMGAYLPNLETGIATARYLEEQGVDLLNISYSMVQPLPAPADFPLSDMAYGGWQIKQAVGIPVIGVGGITSQSKAETLLSNEFADFAGVARGILADPAFPKKIMAGERPNECAGCAECFWRTDHTKCPARMR